MSHRGPQLPVQLSPSSRDKNTVGPTRNSSEPLGLLSGGLLDPVISQLPCAQELHTYKHFWLVAELTRSQLPRCPGLLSNLHGLLGPFSSQVSDPLVSPISAQTHGCSSIWLPSLLSYLPHLCLLEISRSISSQCTWALVSLLAHISRTWAL